MATFSVKVKPNARDSLLQAVDARSFLAHVKSPPVDGKASAELVALFARHFGCPKSAVRIRAGAGGRTKLVDVDGLG